MLTIKQKLQDLWIQKAHLTALGAYDSHNFMALTTFDFQQAFQFSDIEDPNTVSTASLLPITVSKMILLQQWFASQESNDFSVWFTLSAEFLSIGVYNRVRYA